MREVKTFCLSLAVAGLLMAAAQDLRAAPRKVHVVALGASKKVAYSMAGDPAGAAQGEDSLKIRPLVVDGAVKEWTVGEAHDVTDRSFVVRRAIRLNDELPGEKATPGEKAHAAVPHWVWQRGPWLLVDRTTGHVTAIKLPDYEPGISQVSWFRDYGAYCGLTSSGKSVYAVVAQLAARKPVLSKKLQAFTAGLAARNGRMCPEPEWQRDPLRVTFHPAGKEPVSFEVVPGSAVLVEDSAEDAEEPAAKRE